MRYWVRIGKDEWIIDQADPGSATQPFEGSVIISLQPERVHVIG